MGIIAERLIMEKDLKPRYDFRHLLCLSGLVLVAISFILSIIPNLQDSSTGGWDLHGTVWSVIFVIGNFFGAIYNVQQERCLRMMDQSRTAQGSKWDWQCFILAVQSFSLLATVALGVWLDIVPPGFGTAANMTEFQDNLQTGLGCFFGALGHGQCGLSWMYGLIFNLGYIASYWAAIKLNESSAPFTMISTVMTAPLVVAFWLIFPSLNPSTEDEPLVYVINAIWTGLFGLILYKIWEHTEQARLAAAAAAPVIAQPDIAVDGRVLLQTEGGAASDSSVDVMRS
jgi:hypothetical protein